MEAEEIDASSPLLHVEVDSNHSYFGPHMPTIEAAVVEAMGLVPGQRVIAFMPPDPVDVWNGVVGYDESLPERWQWWVEIVG